MRYIGSKLNLLSQLDLVINERQINDGLFCDIFSGTGVVGRHFKNRFPIASNDFLYFSYVLQYAQIQLNSIPDFTKLTAEIGDPFNYLNSINTQKFDFKSDPFIAINFSPFKSGSRMYFTEKNALQIDAIRQSLQEWLNNEIISKDGFMYLLASLIDFVPSISNIAGTYGAFLKHWDTRTSKSIALNQISLLNNGNKNVAYNENANELIRKISGKVLYIDPPYNGRQYLGNYHVLETVAKYDNPVLKGKTGTREDSSKISEYCKKNKVAQSFHDLLENANFDYIFISYNTEGLLTEEEIVGIVELHSNPQKLKVHKFPYRRYSRIKDESKPNIYEIVLSAVK
jgi:adenine-specific DNA-methyltransferase